MGDYKHFFDTTWKKSHVETFSSGVFFYFTTNKLCFPEAADICLVSYTIQDPASLTNVVEMWRKQFMAYLSLNIYIRSSHNCARPHVSRPRFSGNLAIDQLL